MNGTEGMTEGFCYVADRAGYIREAELSAASLKRRMPVAQVALVCPTSLFRRDSIFDHHIALDENYSGPIVKTQAIKAPFDRVMLIDTDTLITADLTDVFRVLEHFDIAVGHEPTRGWDYPCEAPPAFCELNTGVVLFRNNDRVQKLFGRWFQKYFELRKAHRLVNDQPAFRSVLWESDSIRVATLPSEFHCIVGKPVSIAWEARLLHGRDDLFAIAGEINGQLGYRAFVPGWGQLRGYAGRKDLLRQYCKLTLNFFRMLLLKRWHSDSSATAPEKWWTK